jgi:glycosyltransferase involved in cell wall biosynthesis
MENLKVVFLSEWLANPYKELLGKHLHPKGIQVEEYSWSTIFLPLVLRQGKTDILHFHTLHRFLLGRNELTRFLKALLFINQLAILRVLGTRAVWTVHEWTNKAGKNEHNITPTQAAIISGYLHAIIAHCDTTKDEVTQAFQLTDTKKVFVVPHGNYIGSYENTISQPDARKALGIPAENSVFLLFGGIYPYKGVLEAIDAFQHLPQTQISLLIAGNPSDDELKEEITQKIRGYENILFVPKRIPDDDVQIYMNACDCVILPYQVFTTSGVAILAMSFGRACIAPKMGFFGDVLDESGAFLYDSTQEEGLLQAMKCALEKKNTISEMGKHNLQLAEQWNWDYVAEETFSIYQKCLE